VEEGKRFSQVYLEQGAPVRDSVRFRNRIAAHYRQYVYVYEEREQPIRKAIQRETGAKVPFTSHYDVAKFFETAELRDVLDAITLTHQTLDPIHRGVAKEWKDFIDRVFREENLGYRLDLKCGVHYFIDEEFERNRVSTLTVLDDENMPECMTPTTRHIGIWTVTRPIQRPLFGRCLSR
jgi:hypothetical protein